MILRVAKLSLVLGLAIYYSFVVLNNVTDYNSNFQFVRHVMMMDSTLPQNHGMWRATNQPWVHTFSYLSIIAWEIVTMLLCWWGGFAMIRALQAQASAFHLAKRVAIVALTLSLLMWLVAFLSVGAEWFLMWQSKTWDVRVPHVCGRRPGVVAGLAAGFRPAAVRLRNGGVGFAVSTTSEEPKHPGN